MAPVASIHFFGDMVNAFEPACVLNPSNSTGLKSGLLSCSHRPRNSIVSRLCIQFFDHVIRRIAFVPCNICQQNIVVAIAGRKNRNLSSFSVNAISALLLCGHIVLSPLVFSRIVTSYIVSIILDMAISVESKKQLNIFFIISAPSARKA